MKREQALRQNEQLADSIEKRDLAMKKAEGDVFGAYIVFSSMEYA